MSDTKLAFILRFKAWIVAGIIILLVVNFMPLFSIVPLHATQQKNLVAQFDAKSYVARFWQEDLQEAVKTAVDATVLLDLMQTKPADAAKRYGHRLGLSSSVTYFVKGQGTVVFFEDGIVGLSLHDNDLVMVEIDTGPIFGNAVRDGSGVLSISDFANTQDFNAVSAEINLQVEQEVLPLAVNNGKVGSLLYFVGAVEVNDFETTPTVLSLVPVVIEAL
ncbi:DUF2291 family protein [Paraglaciecola hydrolytica]|uniref:Uncharacterized protein n=1 Tax=Paraglaciecola hydrolytica TaxID=1799789 RepID=A0A148KKE0_9ALTE|nr:DUF2291 family protein [Paraglaciecola hydrolytica]KXI26757.1 hypothetical protein AX660_03005 [Paraglaciecola hydrolytica]